MRAAIYVRVSTDEQGDKNLSIPFQLETCRGCVLGKNWEVTTEYVDVASGKTDKRQNFQRLIADARAKLFDVVIVYKYSRFARCDSDSILYENELNKKGIVLVSATEPIDSSTSTGWLNKRILQTFAEFENKQRSEFIKGGMRERLLRGGWVWKAPLGYRNCQNRIDSKHMQTWIELDPDVAPLVERIFQMAAGGQHSVAELCDLAEDVGLTTSHGRAFTSEKMLRVLRNPFYKGYVVSPEFNVDTKGIHEALVDESLWDRVQLNLAVRGKAPYLNHRHKHVLRGLTRCSCGLAMTAEFHDGGRNAYLRCMSSANRRYKWCGNGLVRLDVVVRQIEKEVLPSLAVTTDDVDAIREELHGLLRKDYHTIQAEIEVLRARVAQIESRLQKLLDIRLDEEIGKDEYQHKRAALNIERAQLTHKLEMNVAVVSKGEEDLGRALKLASELLDVWVKADDEGKHEILEVLFAKFVVDKQNIVDVEVKAPYNWLLRLGCKAQDGLLIPNEIR